MRRERSVIVFAGALYDAPLWTNRQHVASRLADRGWRVLYVEPRLLLARVLLGRFLGTAGRFRWLFRHLVSWRAHPSLWVLAQSNRIPGSRRFPWIGRFNHLLFNAWNVRWQARRLGFRDAALLLYDAEAAEFLDDFPRAKAVYDCVDDHRAQAGAVGGNAALVEHEEAAIAARAAAIVVTTEPLRERFSRMHSNVQLVPNAADIHAFLHSPAAGDVEPPDLRPIPHPRIGTVGALDAYKIDVPLLRQVVQAHPEWQFVLVGPINYASMRGSERASVRELRAHRNVHLLGPKTRDQIPAYVHGFDVAIIPYRESAYNRASFPLKFWEFMASGKPIVASGLPALEPYRHLVTLVRTPEEFSRAVAEALADPTRGASARIEEAKRHSWADRVDQIERLLS